ncbi:MAG: LPS assembly lipoprotein LptE [Planctomycetaceae bacterium]|nr:LPS assembly lipoprotein LptE [Planctomycetaceae bacterium]
MIFLLQYFLFGCSTIGYNVGMSNPFGNDVKTVYVPIFESDVLRRDLSERLTEAVCKRIESRTSYKVVSRPSADSVLEGKIVRKTRGVSLVNNYNDPRQMLNSLTVEIRWQDRRKRDLLEFDPIPWNVGNAQIMVSNYLVPEFGQSELTAEQAEINMIAEKIVGMMEIPW